MEKDQEGEAVEEEKAHQLLDWTGVFIIQFEHSQNLEDGPSPSQQCLSEGAVVEQEVPGRPAVS